MMNDVERLIALIRNSHRDMEDLYMYGQCYNFGKILREVFSGVICFSRSEGHVYTYIDGHYYDIRGKALTVPDDTVTLDHRDGDRPHRSGPRDSRYLYDECRMITIRKALAKNPDPEALHSFSKRSPTHIPVFIEDDTFSYKKFPVSFLKNCTRDHFYLKTDSGLYYFMPSNYKEMTFDTYLTSLKDIYNKSLFSPETAIVPTYDIKEVFSEVLSNGKNSSLDVQFLSFDIESAREEYYGYPVLTEEDMYLLQIQ